MDFTNPVIVGALVAGVAAVIGTIGTVWNSRRHDRSETALEALKTLADKHSERVEKLEVKVDVQAQRIDELAEEIDRVRKEKRRIQEKYSVSLTYISQLWTSWYGLQIHLDRDGIEHGSPPPVPKVIAEDLHAPPDNVERAQSRDPPA